MLRWQHNSSSLTTASFSAIVIFVAIAILILVFVVLTTTILLLSIKHRNLVKQQQQQRQNQETESDAEKDSKEHYMGSLDNPDNHNIYSTHSTRTNSSSGKCFVFVSLKNIICSIIAHYFLDKNGPTETGTIITRSGSTGSQRSSTSSSFPVYLDQPTSSSSPGPNTGIISRTINSLHNHQRRSPHSQLMNNQAMQFGTMNGANVSHHPHHHQRPTSPPFFANSVFDAASELNSPMISVSFLNFLITFAWIDQIQSELWYVERERETVTISMSQNQFVSISLMNTGHTTRIFYHSISNVEISRWSSFTFTTIIQ